MFANYLLYCWGDKNAPSQGSSHTKLFLLIHISEIQMNKLALALNACRFVIGLRKLDRLGTYSKSIHNCSPECICDK